jgi:Tol biopolymer transport system component
MRTIMVPAAVAAAVAAGGAGRGAVPTENGTILFVRACEEATPQAQLFVVSPDGSQRTSLAGDADPDVGPAASPDGRRIAFVSRRDGYPALFEVDADGGGRRRLNERLFDVPYRLSTPIWAPDGNTIAVEAPYLGGDPRSQATSIVVADAEAGEARRVAEGTGFSFSPDGRMLAFEHRVQAFARPEIRIVSVSGLGEGFLVEGESPEWAPRGERILFVRTQRGGGRSLWTIDGSGRRWTLRRIRVGSPAWSPNGRRIAFARPSGRRAGVYVVRRGARLAQRLAALTGVREVVWSPNGAWLALATPGRAYLVRTNGRLGLRRIGAQLAGLRWSPDSRRLAFYRARHKELAVLTIATRKTTVAVDTAKDGAMFGAAWLGRGRLVVATAGPAESTEAPCAVSGSGLHR